MLWQLINQTFLQTTSGNLKLPVFCVENLVSKRVNEGTCFARSFFYSYFLPSNAIVIPKKFIVKGTWLKKRCFVSLLSNLNAFIHAA